MKRKNKGEREKADYAKKIGEKFVERMINPLSVYSTRTDIEKKFFPRFFHTFFPANAYVSPKISFF